MSPPARRSLWIAWNVLYLGGAIVGVAVTLMWSFDPRSHDHYEFYRWNQWLIIYLALGYFANKLIRRQLVDDAEDDEDAEDEENEWSLGDSNP
ncbi:MAG: hypothetical protein ACJ71Z_01635 [Aeromicrobium sp.]